MTKKPEFLKLVSVAIMASGLLAGCASDSATDEGVSSSSSSSTASDSTAKKGPSAAAKNAIYSAKIKNARAERAGYAWRDTAKLIAAAEKAAANGDNDKAIALANKAKTQSEAALEQAEIEKLRYEKNHGSTTLGDSAGTSSSGSSGSAGDYTVVSGDNLWNISGKDSVYGNPYQWPLIFKANAAKIQDADLIFPGQVFSIPSASSSEVSAAVQHAKTRGAWTVGESEQSDLDYVLGFK